MRQMDSVKLPSGMHSLEDGMVPRPESLQDSIQSFCQEKKSLKEAGIGIPYGSFRENERKQGAAMASTKPRGEGNHVCSDATES